MLAAKITIAVELNIPDYGYLFVVCSFPNQEPKSESTDQRIMVRDHKSNVKDRKSNIINSTYQ